MSQLVPRQRQQERRVPDQPKLLLGGQPRAKERAKAISEGNDQEQRPDTKGPDVKAAQPGSDDQREQDKATPLPLSQQREQGAGRQ